MNKKKIYKYILIFSVIYLISSCNHRQHEDSKTRNYSSERIRINSSTDKTIIKMEKIGGVFQIPVDVNGVRMSFIFDTGASNISISTTEAMFLAKQGLLSKDDIVGSQKFLDANGDISEGTVINLKTVKIGNRILNNIEAGVVDNLNAPLLFGQSALGKFGKISIDNNRGEITFE